jgi:hypothetical protein
MLSCYVRRFLIAVTAITLLPLAASADLILNEVDYDQVGTDAAEFVELKNTGGAAVDLSLYSLEFINGSGGAVYLTTALPAVMLAPGAYFVVCANAATVPNCNLDITPDTNLIQNGAPDAIVLKLGAAIVDALSYEGATGAPNQEGSGTTAADDNVSLFLGLSRVPDGSDTNDNAVDWALACITPGYVNTSSTTACDQPVPSRETTWGLLKSQYQ